MKTGDNITISIENGRGFINATFQLWVNEDTIAYTVYGQQDEGYYFTHYKSVVFINGVPV